MNKQEQATKQKEALKLYLTGMAKDQIAKALHIADRSIDRWEIALNWKELYKRTDEKVTQEIVNSVAEEKVRSLKLIKAVESIFAQQLQNGITIKPSEFAQIQKVKWEILMPKTVSQYNFMKTETNTNLISNEEASRALEALKEYEQRIARKSNNLL